VEIVRIQQPSPEEYAAAAEVCEIRWPFQKPYHTAERFAGFARMGVELIAARENGRFQAVCFAAPCRWVPGGGDIDAMFLFQLATRPETRNVGGLLMMRIMGSYGAVAAQGVTEEAIQMYKALRWKHYNEVWRGIHPLRAKPFYEDYHERVHKPWKKVLLRGGLTVFEIVSVPANAVLSTGSHVRRMNGVEGLAAFPSLKLSAIDSYWPVLTTDNLRVVNAGGIGRLLVSYAEGWGHVGEHAAIWKAMRNKGAKFVELLISSEAARAKALQLGYVPVDMPLWYLDRNGSIAKIIEALRSDQFSFLYTDKSI
jgi:hypothetical protein